MDVVELRYLAVAGDR